jgi:hypothetical protein
VNVCYDTEFLEDGETIELISIGMVAEDGYEYYAVNRDMPERRIRRHPWLMENVVPNVIISLIAACGPVGTANTLQAIGHWFSVFFSALTS